MINEHVFGGGLFKTTVEDIEWRGLEKPAKVDEAQGDAIERTGATLWVAGDAAGLVTIAWIVACIETRTPWDDPAAQKVFEKLRKDGHWTHPKRAPTGACTLQPA